MYTPVPVHNQARSFCLYTGDRGGSDYTGADGKREHTVSGAIGNTAKASAGAHDDQNGSLIEDAGIFGIFINHLGKNEYCFLKFI